MRDLVLKGLIERKLKRYYDLNVSASESASAARLPVIGTEACAALLTQLADEKHQVRCDALIAIGTIFENHGVDNDVLAAVVDHSKGIDELGVGPERQACLFALGRSRNEEVIEAFMVLLEGGVPTGITVASFLMGYARWEGAVTILCGLLERAPADTYQAAMWALGQIGSDEAVEALAPFVHHERYAEWAVDALGESGSLGALLPLSEVLNHDDERLCVSALLGLSRVVASVDEGTNIPKNPLLARRIYDVVRRGGRHGPVLGVTLLAELGYVLPDSLVCDALDIPQRGDESSKMRESA